MPKKTAKRAAKKIVKKTVKKAKAAPQSKLVKKVTRKTARKRVGRPKGSGKYGCETKAVRIPSHLVDEIQMFIRRKLKAEGKSTK